VYHGWSQPQEKEPYTDFDQRDSKHTKWLRDKIQLESFRNVARRVDVCCVLASAILNLWYEDHQLHEDNDLGTHTLVTMACDSDRHL